MGLRLKETKQCAYMQPAGTGQCGQYAVANLLNKMPEEIIMAFRATGTNNKKGGTSTKQVAKALRWMGYKVDDRMKIISPNTLLPDYCLISVGWYGPEIASGRRREVAGHWIAYKKGLVICSGAGVYSSLREYTEQNNGYASAYLEVSK